MKQVARLQIAGQDLTAASVSLAAMLEISNDAELGERVLATFDAIG